jgi:hypothetical protein
VSVRLISHINGDADLLPAWFAHYAGLGVASFHVIVHGPRAENALLFDLSRSYPAVIEDAYEGEFSDEEKKRRINALLGAFRGGWLLLVDSDEFVEFPCRTIPGTIGLLERLGANALFAPMIQRITADGSLDSPESIPDPFTFFPLCSIDLYRTMGVDASLSKYPLFFCGEQTSLWEGGNHHPPHGPATVLSSMQGITHHFKWRQGVLERLRRRASGSSPTGQESAGYLAYLAAHDARVPTSDAFAYSRREFFRKGLLRGKSGKWGESFVAVHEARRWQEQLAQASAEVLSVIAAESVLLLADQEELGDALAPGRRRIPFLEKDGQYWGPPTDDETAVREFERLRQAGAEFMVFAWPAFWWLDHYAGLHQHLRAKYRCVLANDRLVVFDLRP